MTKFVPKEVLGDSTFVSVYDPESGDTGYARMGDLVRFGNGTAGAPSITFSGDPDTGLYSAAANTLGFAAGGVVAARLYATEYRLGEGVNIGVGTTTGTRIGFVNTQKLAFWGGTPVVQPSAVANAADSADAVVKLNALLVKLRSIGLIAAV